MNPMKTTLASLTIALATGIVATSTSASEPPQAPLKLAGIWKLNKGLSDDPARKMMEGMRAGGGSEHGGRPGGGSGGMGGPGGGGGGRGGSGGGGGHGGGGGERGSGGAMGGPSGRGPGGRGGGGFMGGEPPLDGTPAEDRPRGERPQGQAGDPGASPGPPDQDGRGPRRPMGLAPSAEFTIEQEGDNLAFRTENNLRLLHTDGEKRKKESEAGKLEVVARFLKGSLVIESRPEMGGKRKETYTLQAERRLQIDFDFEGSGSMPGLKFKLVYDSAAAPQF